jgi:hypothetical protein
MTIEAPIAIAGLLITIGVLCFDFATWSHEGGCPPHTNVDGVTAAGVYRCSIPLGCREHENVRGGWTSSCTGELGYWRRIFCGVDERAVIDLRGIVRCEPWR